MFDYTLAMLDKTATAEKYARLFLIDTIIAEYMKEITFVHDANMYVIYGSSAGVDIDYPEKELVELANIHANEIDQFIAENVNRALRTMLKKWIGLALNPGCDVVFSIPEPVYPELKRFIACVEDDTIDYSDDEIPGAINTTIRHAFVEDVNRCIKKNIYVPVDPKLIAVYIEYLIKLSENTCKLFINNNMVKSRFNSVVSNLVFCVTTLLRMTNVTARYCERRYGSDMRFDDPRILFDTFISSSTAEFGKDAMIKIRKSRVLSPTHVFCLGTNWNEHIILPPYPITVQTDSSRLMATMIYGNQLLNDLFRKKKP